MEGKLTSVTSLNSYNCRTSLFQFWRIVNKKVVLKLLHSENVTQPYMGLYLHVFHIQYSIFPFMEGKPCLGDCRRSTVKF
jgi:hypothetical protein